MFWLFFDSLIGGLNESYRSQGMQSSFSRQSSSNLPASASWRNCYWTLIICTPQRCRPSEHRWEERNGDYWILLVHLCLPLRFVLFICNLNQTAFALYFYLDSDDWKLFLWIKVEGKTPVVSIWTLEGWCVLLSRSIFKCMTLHRCSDSKSLAKSVISPQLVTTSASKLREEWSSRMVENCQVLDNG